MYIESLTVENFQCFGPGRSVINLGPGLTAFIGTNGSGKTAACHALLRLFGISAEDRIIRTDDFHVPATEVLAPDERALTIEAVLAFPELHDDDQSNKDAVPQYFHRMAATDDGALKCRIVLQATWEADGTLEGAVSDTRRGVLTFADEYGDDDWVTFSAADRSRIQMIYVPASRDGGRQMTAFLRGRLWRAAQWSPELRDHVTTTANELAQRFGDERATTVVQNALTTRWQQLHDGGTHATPRFRPLDSDLTQLLRSTELVFEPGTTGHPHPARLLSDGQRSLLHLALTAAALDVEAELSTGRHTDDFDLETAKLPSLTILAIEEPENSLAPFFLSRIVSQIDQICGSRRVQALIASHSASVLTRVVPGSVRYFRHDPHADTAVVRPITLPPEDTEAGKYVREAVQAHPELYFAKFVVLGEGDTEQLVIPRIAQAKGIALDPSFVAMVPLGGRHTNHFWRLLTDLDIPHATLLDLDYGRAGGGVGRLRDACNRLAAVAIDVFADLDGYGTIDDLTENLTTDQLLVIMTHLRKFGVFFASPLDLDFAMLSAYRDAYTALDPGERGPQTSDPVDAVLVRQPDFVIVMPGSPVGVGSGWFWRGVDVGVA